MSGVNECDRCKKIIRDQNELHHLPDLTTNNKDRDVCQRCWDDFVYWWNNVVRPKEAM